MKFCSTCGTYSHESAGQNSHSTAQQTCLCYAMLQTTETLLGLLANLVGALNKILLTWLHCGSPESEIGIVTSCTLGATESSFREGMNRLNRVWGPHSPLFNGYHASFPGLKRPLHDADHSTPPTYE
jgi:hypothetical protein